MSYGPGEKEKTVPVKLLELGEGDALLGDKQVKQFVMDLSNPRQGAKLGRYPRTTITIADKGGTGAQKHSAGILYIELTQPRQIVVKMHVTTCGSILITYTN